MYAEVVETQRIENITLNEVNNPDTIMVVKWIAKAIDMKYHWTASRSSETPLQEFVDLAGDDLIGYYDQAQSPSSHAAMTIVFTYDECICRVVRQVGSGDAGSFYWRISSNDKEKGLALNDKIVDMLPVKIFVNDDVHMSFWTLGPHGPQHRSRAIVAPKWDDIEHNYPMKVREDLGELMELTGDHKSGQLIMLYGVPGTGKSYAIRALAREWKKWCTTEYIVDPEKFFGSSAEYMISVLLGNEHSSGSKWKLYIVEDGDEFLTGDAKLRSGQALSRLLNVVDGMIGQGLRVIVLVTTNEPLDNIHDAVTRPGRCLANIQFSKFSTKEAEEWLDNGSDVNEEKTLAELYYELGEVTSVQPKDDEKKSIGF